MSGVLEGSNPGIELVPGPLMKTPGVSQEIRRLPSAEGER